MFKLEVENTNGQILTLSQNESKFQIVDIDGLNPPKAILNSSIIAGMDGAKFNSSRLDVRNIVITLRLNGNVEENRIFLYQYFRTKQWCKIYYKNSTRDVFIEGYVENIDCSLFTKSELMQISIICYNPYFREAKEIVDDISKALAAFVFPFAFGDGDETDPKIEFSTIDNTRITNVKNNSEFETGVIIELTFNGEVVNPTIKDTVTGNTFGITGTYGIGDRIVIDTNKGNKSITLYENGVPSNIFNKIVKGSTWFQLQIGDNYYAYLATSGAEFIYIVFKHHTIYEGV